MLSGPYSLVEVNHILAIAESLLDCDEKLLLKLSHDAQSAALFDEKLRAKLSQPSDPIELIKLVDTTLSELSELCKTREFNRNHLLAYLMTSRFQKGAIFNTDSLSVVSAWHILHACVKELRSAPRMTNDAVEGIFLGFIGQLADTHHVDTAKAIHQLLFMGQKIAASKACGMGVSNTAKIIGSTLLQGLKLSEGIEPEDLAQEFKLFAKVCEVLLAHPLFTKPFNAQDYTMWSLSKGPFYSIQAAVLGPLGDPKSLSIFKLYPDEIMRAQARLATVIQTGAAQTPTPSSSSTKEVKFKDDEMEVVTAQMGSFSLISPRTLATQFESKRQQEKRSSQPQAEQAKNDEKSEGKKKRRATLSEGSKKK